MKTYTKIAGVPYIIWMILFIVAPLGMVFYYALTDRSGSFTLENISGIGQYTAVFARSIWLALIATVICLVLGSWLHRVGKRSPDERVESFAIALGWAALAIVAVTKWGGAGARKTWSSRRGIYWRRSMSATARPALRSTSARARYCPTRHGLCAPSPQHFASSRRQST